MKKWIALSIIIILGIVLFLKLRPQPTKIKTETVKRGTIVKSVSASGKVNSEEVVELKFQTSGLLSWLGVKEGDTVSKWQAIASLDTKELQKTLEKALRDYSSERNDFEEAKQVTYDGQTIEVAASGTIKRILQKNQWDLEKAVLDVELKDLALKYATLITPISGIVTSIDTPVAGVNITPASAVFTVANPQKMIFIANVDETDMADLTAGLSAQITLDAFPEIKFPSIVQKISFSAVSTSGGGTAYPVELSLPSNDDLRFKLGMNGDAEIITDKKDDVLVISSDFVFKKDGKSYVWLVQSNKTLKREVKIGLTNDSQSEVLEGLKENDKTTTSFTDFTR